MKLIGSRSKLLFVIILIFTITNMTDLVSSYFVLGGEANPLYLLTGNIWIVYGLKIGITIFFWWLYYYNTYDTEFFYYQYLMISILGAIGFTIGASSNILAIYSEPIMTAAVATTTVEKYNYYTLVSLIIFIIPAATMLFLFKVFQWTHGKANIKKRTMTCQ